MRIGPLARKIGVRPSDIIEYLQQAGMEKPGAHTRLDETQVRQVLARFEAEAAFAGLDIAMAEPEPEPAKSAPAPVVEEVAPAEAPQTEPLPATTSEPSAETIKAPKVELSGLKILGKIDLPEKKKKETESAPATTAREQARAPRKPQRSKAQEPPVLTSAQLREAEARAEIERRRKEKEEQKALRALRYYSQMKKAPKSSSRMKRADTMPTQPPPRPEPRTWLGKILRWFTS